MKWEPEELIWLKLLLPVRVVPKYGRRYTFLNF